MTYKGHVENGVVVLDEPRQLPEGAVVEVALVTEEEADLPSLRELFLKYAGKAKGLPSDLARNHDHYLHGLPKK